MAYVPYGGVTEQQKKEAEKEGEGFLSRAASNIGTSVSEFAKGAVSGAREVLREGENLAETNPLALTGTPMEEGITNAPAPEQTGEQQQAYEQYKKATGAFGEETLEPVVAPLAVAATLPVSGPALGAVGSAAQILLAPSFISQIGQAAEKGGVGQVAKELTIGQSEEFLSNPNLAKQFYDKPVSTIAQGAMSLLQPALIAAGVARGVTGRTTKGIIERTQRAEEELTRPADQGALRAEEYRKTQEEFVQNETKTKELENLGEQANKDVLDNMKPWQMTREEWNNSNLLENENIIRSDNLIMTEPYRYEGPIYDAKTLYEIGSKQNAFEQMKIFQIANEVRNGMDFEKAIVNSKNSEIPSILGGKFVNYNYELPSNMTIKQKFLNEVRKNNGADVTKIDMVKNNFSNVESAKTGVPVEFIGFRQEEGTSKRIPGTGTFYAIDPGTSGVYGMSRVKDINVLDTAYGGSKETLTVDKVKFNNPLVISGGHDELVASINSLPFSDKYKKMIVASWNRKGEEKYILLDKAIARAAKDSGYDGIIYKRISDYTGNDSEIVSLNNRLTHKQIVEQAIKEGKEVPANVMSEYPDLKQEKPSEKFIEQGALKYDVEPSVTEYDRPVTRKEIVNDINSFVQSRTGRIGKPEYEGIYKVAPEVVRVRKYGDFDTYAHEIGHYVDKTLKLAGNDNELINIADKIWGKNEIYNKYTDMQKRAEGVAEFTREYLLNPQEAKNNFPNYYNDFVKTIGKNADVKNRLDIIGNKMRAWYSQPAEARARGGVSLAGEENIPLIKKAKDIAYKVREQWLDDKVGLSKLTNAIEKELGVKLSFEDNPYKQARMAQSISTMAAEMLVSGKNPALTLSSLNKLYGGKLKNDVTMYSILQKLDSSTLNEKYPNYLKTNNFKNWQEALSTVIVARRQLEIQKLNEKYQGSMSKQDAELTVSRAPKEIMDAAEDFYKYNDNLLTIAEDSGLISREVVTALREKYKEYALMGRDFSDESALTDSFSTGKKIGNISNPLKKLTEEGSARSVIDPLESAIKNTYTILSAAERNKVAQTFIRLSDIEGAGKFVERVPGTTGDQNKSIFTVMVDGEKQAFQTTPEFYRAIMSMNAPTANSLISLFKPFAKALRIGATISPDFMIRNMIRDTLTAGILTETGFKPFIGTIKGAKTLISNKELASQFKAAGVPMSNFVGLDRPGLSNVLSKMGGGSSWNKIKPIQIVNGVIESFRKASELSESSTRMGEFQRALEQGKGIREAGFLAKDITLDFTKSGTLGRQVNQVVPFFNAVLQGGDRFYKALKENPQRTTAFALQYITLPSIALWLINHNEEWYQEMNDDVKNASWLIKSGDTIIRIPKPFEPGIIFGSSFERALDRAYNDDKEAVTQWAKYALDNFTPAVMPAIAGPIIEWITNYNMFTKKPIVGKKEQELPDEMQFNAYSSEVAKRLGKLTGTSPMKIDNTINGFTASAGKFAIGLIDKLISDKNLPQKTLSEQPAVKGLTYTPLKNPRSVNLFYEKLDELQKEHNVYGKSENVPKNLKTLQEANKKISELNKKNREITSGNKSPEEKRSLIDENNSKILELSKSALSKI